MKKISILMKKIWVFSFLLVVNTVSFASGNSNLIPISNDEKANYDSGWMDALFNVLKEFSGFAAAIIGLVTIVLVGEAVFAGFQEFKTTRDYKAFISTIIAASIGGGVGAVVTYLLMNWGS